MEKLYKKEEIKKMFGGIGDRGLEQLIIKGIVAKVPISDRIIRYVIKEELTESDSFEHKFVVEYIKPVKIENNNMRVDVPYVRQYKTKKKGTVYYFGVNKNTADKVYATTGFLLRNKKFTDFREAEKYSWDMYETYIKQTLKSYSKPITNKGSLRHLWKEFQKYRFVKENETAAEKMLAPRTQKDYKDCYNKLSNLTINSSVKFIDIKLTNITGPQALAIYGNLYKEIKERRSKMCMDFLRSIYEFGRKHGFLTGDNPFAKLGIPQSENSQRLWEEWEIRAFCAAAEEMRKPEYALAVKLNLYLSLRPSDFLKLRTADIKYVGNGTYCFTTISNKTKIESYGFFPEELYNEIDKSKDKIINVTLGTFEKNFRKIVLQAGIDGCVFKNIRNTAITNYFNAGAEGNEVASISGHKKVETTYNVYRKNTPTQSNNGYKKLIAKESSQSVTL